MSIEAHSCAVIKSPYCIIWYTFIIAAADTVVNSICTRALKKSLINVILSVGIKYGGEVWQATFFAMISRLKYIDRWALMRNTHEENLSEHCMETACIAHALAVIGNRRFGKYYNAERAALLGLYHDAPETLTGDMPTPVKYYSPRIREAYAQVEQSACEHLVSMLPEDLRRDFAPFFF